MVGIEAMMVQFFYAWRIRVLTHNIWMVSAVIMTSLIGGRTYSSFIELESCEI